MTPRPRPTHADPLAPSGSPTSSEIAAGRTGSLDPFAPSRAERQRGPRRGASLPFLVAPAIALILAAPAAARAGKDDFGDAAVVFARDHALWRTDPKGKGPATELLTLPGGARAADVRTIRTDAAGAVILLDVAGAWYWLRAATPDELTPLPCATDARVTVDGKSVVCADADGHAIVYSLRTRKHTRRKVPGAGARVLPAAPVADGEPSRGRELVYADADGVWAAPLAASDDRRELAPDAPLRGFSASPDGTRALGVYLTTAWQKRTAVEAEGLMTFALDGKAARRKSIRGGVVIDWSWDGAWILVQDGESACVARAVGGEYKCWKGYGAVSLSPDGKWALVVGKRKAPEGGDKDDRDDKDDADAPADAPAGDGGGEGGDEPDDTEATADAPAAPGIPAGPLSLYRAKLEGAYTERPALVETVIDGPGALWLPGGAAAK